MNNEVFDEELRIASGTIRNLARKLIKRAQIKRPPVLLNKIFKCLDHKISIIAKDLGDNCGFSVGTTQIVYNSRHPRTRSKFTIAHELGHILLGHNSTSKSISLETRDPIEMAANEFAAELLVPRQMLKNEELHSSSLSELANKYRVSKEMMIWRLKSTGFYLKLRDWN